MHKYRTTKNDSNCEGGSTLGRFWFTKCKTSGLLIFVGLSGQITFMIVTEQTKASCEGGQPSVVETCLKCATNFGSGHNPACVDVRMGISNRRSPVRDTLDG